MHEAKISKLWEADIPFGGGCKGTSIHNSIQNNFPSAKGQERRKKRIKRWINDKDIILLYPPPSLFCLCFFVVVVRIIL
jgi:hypothetical protein